MTVLKNDYEISLWEDLITDEYGYSKLTTRPNDWSSANYVHYYTKSGNNYIPVAATTWAANTYYQYNSTTKEYDKLTSKPSDWDSKFYNYYYFLATTTQGYYKLPVWVPGTTYYDRFTKFKEYKVGVIGSSSMVSESRAIEPCLTSNINGTNTLTFKMFYTYIDTLTGERVENSWILLLVNEARLKVKWKDKWYDFVIKNRVEDSSGKSVTFTCEDLFVNELSKTGFNLEFDTELENNLGTVFELAQKALTDTDWTLVKPGDTYPTIDGETFAPEIIKQYTEEPVYEIYGEYWRHFVNAVNVDTNTSLELRESNNYKLLLFYSQVEKNATTLLCVCCDSLVFPTETNSLLVVRNKVDRYDMSNLVWSEGNKTIGGVSVACWIVKLTLNGSDVDVFWIPKSLTSANYRAERLVDSQLSTYDPKSQKYVLEYKDTENNNKLTYGFTKTDYDTALMVTNVATWDTKGPSGWLSTEDVVYWTIYPEFTQNVDVNTYTSEGYVRITGGKTLTNTGIGEHKTFLEDGILAGYLYMVRFRAGTGNASTPTTVPYTSQISDLTIAIKYDGNSSDYFSNPTKSTKNETINGKDATWLQYTFTCKKSILLKNLGKVTITFNRNSNNPYLWITDLLCFLILRDSSNNIIYPGDFAAQARTAVRYYYYYPDNNKKAKSLDDIDMVMVSEDSLSRFSPILDENNAKIRSISVKQSNRFNILLTLAETFLCWVKFGIVHNSNTGQILTNSAGMPRKYITFVNSIGEDKGYGFVYGIDLKTILRTVLSKLLVTKTIVQPNSNEFGEQGFCTILRAIDNVPKTNFIINLDYFIANGMLDGGELSRDLYSKVGDDLGYYIRLKELNTAYDKSLTTYLKLLNELLSQLSTLEVYTDLVKSTQNELNRVENNLISLSGKKTINEALTYFKTHSNDLSKAWVNERSRLKNQKSSYNTTKNKLTKSVQNIELRIDKIEDQNKEYVKQIEDLDKAFNTKYARYLQEGSWISEDYMDDNLYYLDGLSVAYVASRPQVLYSISVLRLTALEEFKNKIFNVGDIGFIEDKEFFGYEIDKITPRKEQIVVSLMASYFDSPERDTITILNYKTLFEDLFQRITSTTQSLLFAQGEYAKVAATINSDMTIKAELLLSSLSLNLKIVTNATNESVLQDGTGITVVDTSNPNLLAKLTSGGILFTNDGGTTWTTGIDSLGVRANYIKTGVVNTNEVIIGPAASPSFRWDSDGLNAYAWVDDPSNIITSQFVRFDLYGIYGIKGNENFSSDGYYVPVDTTQATYDPEVLYYALINGLYVEIPQTLTGPTDWGNSTTDYDPWEYDATVWPSKYNLLYVYDELTDTYVLNTDPEYDEDLTYYTTIVTPVTYYEENGKGLDTIKYYASFGLVWDGFFMKNRYGNGYIEISSENDILVIDNSNISRIKIGNIGTVNNPIYGIRIKNGSGNDVLVTGSDGKLWLLNMLTVGNGTTSTVNIGYNPSNDTQDTHNGAHEVFLAGSGSTNFIVYEDGFMRATGGEFTGEINATGGTIGGLSIETIEEATYKVQIDASGGTVFKNGVGTKVLTATLYLGADIILQNVTYLWYKNGSLIVGLTSRTYTTTSVPSAADVYSCACTYSA